jgi:hypothetical protein
MKGLMEPIFLKVTDLARNLGFLLTCEQTGIQNRNFYFVLELCT